MRRLGRLQIGFPYLGNRSVFFNTGTRSVLPRNFQPKDGGVFALLITSVGIREWFFPRDHVPKNVLPTSRDQQAPNPNTWGRPIADFPATLCDIPSHFYNLTLSLDIDWCGGWAGSRSVVPRTGCGPRFVDIVVKRKRAFRQGFLGESECGRRLGGPLGFVCRRLASVWGFGESLRLVLLAKIFISLDANIHLRSSKDLCLSDWCLTDPKSWTRIINVH